MFSRKSFAGTGPYTDDAHVAAWKAWARKCSVCECTVHAAICSRGGLAECDLTASLEQAYISCALGWSCSYPGMACTSALQFWLHMPHASRACHWVLSCAECDAEAQILSAD